jgi:acetyltransferase-like isoleucine patch superfamily enzyme
MDRAIKIFNFKRNECKIFSHTFIVEGEDIADNAKIGHNVTLLKDTTLRHQPKNYSLKTEPI